jgi:hypothetical protein
MLSTRQRAAPPIDKTHNRRGLSRGGYDTATPMTLAPGLETELPRYPGTSFDGQIIRERVPFYSATTRSAVGDSWVNWTEAGPVRAELHMRTTQYRHEVGSSQGRYPFIPTSPTGGRHTMTPHGVQRTAPRFQETQQQTGARINRLSSARYSGQSYSQTTAVQGASVRRAR